MTNILTTLATDDDILKTDAGNPFPVHLIDAASLVAGSLNFQYSQQPAAAIGPVVGGGVWGAGPGSFSGPAFASKTGTVVVFAFLTADASGGGTAPAGDLVTLTGLVDGAARGVPESVELSPTHGTASGCLFFVAAVTPSPATHTFGIKASDATNAADTLTIPAGHAAVFVLDVG
jgi:hypothetical protein